MVEIGTETPWWSSASRLWSLSAWPLRTKAAVLMVLPLLLAVGLGSLRIHTEFSASAEQLSAADDARALAPALRLDGLVGDLALRGTPGSDQSFADAVEAVYELLDENDRDKADAVNDLDAALAATEILRLRMQGVQVPAVERAAVAKSMTGALSDVLAVNLSVDSSESRASLRTVTGAMSGRRAAQTQQLLMSIPDNTVLDQVNRVVGVESAEISALERVLGADSSEITRLQALLNARLSMYAAATRTGPTNPFLSAEQSADLYGSIADRYGENVVDSLSSKALDSRSAALRDTALVLSAFLLVLALLFIVARSLNESIRSVRPAADEADQHALPAATEQVTPIPIHIDEENRQWAPADNDVQNQVQVPAEEPESLQVQIEEIFEALAHKSCSLIEDLERDQEDPDTVDSLGRLDDLATRMRRSGANLMALARTPSSRTHSDRSVALDAVMNAAVFEVDDVGRLPMVDVPDVALIPSVARDVVHLVAELIDNALRHSPPTSAVDFTAVCTAEGGVLLEVADRGSGMSAPEISEANGRLEAGGKTTPETAQRMGLFVVARLAKRAGVTVRLRADQAEDHSSGVIASIHIPVSLIDLTAPPSERRTHFAPRDVLPVALEGQTSPLSAPTDEHEVSEWLVDPATGQRSSPSR